MNFLENIATAERILNLAINSFLILVLGWIFARLTRKTASPVRSGIIIMTVVVLTILPILNLASFVPEISSLTIGLPISLSHASSPSLEMANPSTSATLNSQLAPLSSSSFTQKSVQRILHAFDSIQSGPALIQMINSLGIIWLMGSLIMFLKLAHGVLSLKGYKKDLVEIRNARILQILLSAERSFTNRPRAEIFASKKISSPQTLGLFNPLIILPHSFYEKVKTSEIRGILAHELSHIYHRDQLMGMLQRSAAALYWWNPFIHILNADFSRAREEIADNHALLESDKKEYAECLIDLAERTSLLSRLPVSTGLASPRFPLKDRVTNILSKERKMETKLKKSTLWMIVLVSLCILGTISGHRWTFASAEKILNPELKTESAAESIQETEPDPTAKAESSAVAIPLSILQEKQDKTDKPKNTGRKIVKPKLIKKVDPVYPDEARESGLEGAVVVEAITDAKGNVIEAKVIKGEHEILNKAAVAAVKQWEYQPFIINGKPIPVEFTVTMKFNLKEKEKTASSAEVLNAGVNVDVIDLPEDIELKLIKKIEPEYPREALKKHTGGKVILDALIDREGNVVEARVIESEHEILNSAAINAVKQWKYEPYKENGIPKKVRYKVALEFKVK